MCPALSSALVRATAIQRALCVVRGDHALSYAYIALYIKGVQKPF